MNKNIETLLVEIKRKRMLMIQSAEMNGLINEKTIRYSQELDVLMNEYQMQKPIKKKEVKIHLRQMTILFEKQFSDVKVV